MPGQTIGTPFSPRRVGTGWPPLGLSGPLGRSVGWSEVDWSAGSRSVRSGRSVGRRSIGGFGRSAILVSPLGSVGRSGRSVGGRKPEAIGGSVWSVGRSAILVSPLGPLGPVSRPKLIGPVGRSVGSVRSVSRKSIGPVGSVSPVGRFGRSAILVSSLGSVGPVGRSVGRSIGQFGQLEVDRSGRFGRSDQSGLSVRVVGQSQSRRSVGRLADWCWVESAGSRMSVDVYLNHRSLRCRRLR